jgi:adenylate kinase
MGPPGAGKGTQGELLARRYGVSRFSTGDILRAARRDGTQLGREAQRYMDAGELVPDDLILGMMREALVGPTAGKGFLLDGFPRTVAQAEGLDRLLAEIGRGLDVVVNLEVPDTEIVRRLSSRRVCAECEAMAPAGSGAGEACDCGGELRTRTDDDPETVRRRLQVYHEQTEPVLAWYRDSATPVQSVPGSGPVEEVQERVARALAA